ncbi:ATP-binding protein [Nocardia huaxiensis]|uniref:ATP-binding protein n=1 Tax=Nocardia huaxiensis TaxID=2755382 RepID=UPI001E3F5B2E|nr:tetratricopeptide repeat protein [Nocardia huaxiensis]UFS98777.1 tetratricopeptide repeat protein [Nocardia huaxiensis]
MRDDAVGEENQLPGNSARSEFAAGLVALFAAAGNPTLQRVATAAERRLRLTRGAGQRTTKLVPRISDWRAGRNLPSRFETFQPVLLTLIELARAGGGQVAAASNRAESAGAAEPTATGAAPAASKATGAAVAGVAFELLDVAAWHRLWTAAQDEGVARAAVVNTLRRDLGTFVGRDAELGRILAAAEPGRVLSIHTIDGMAGVGKTALATRAAHLLAERFPDGQYFVELHAHTPGQVAADPADVLGTLLLDLGVDSRSLPESLAARRNMWRDQVSGRRVLLVLDDARDHDQIEPLLPAGDGCLTLVTSRRRLIALDGASPVTLEVLDAADAVELFAALSGRPATRETAAIVELCGRLPLAISLLAGRLAHHPRWTLGELIAEFTATRARLDEFDDGGHRAVRAAFTTSYARLPADRQRLFRRLGAHPGLDIDVYAVAALDDSTVAEARRAMEALYLEHLIDETSYGRYRLHDLIRAYARELIDEDPIDREESIQRVLDYYQYTALRLVHPRRGLSAPAHVPRRPDLSTPAATVNWIRVERANLLAGLAAVAARGQLARAVDLATALVGEIRLHSTWPQAVAMQQRLAVSGDTINPHDSETLALKDLGGAGYLAEDYGTICALLINAMKTTAGESDPALHAEAWAILARTRMLTGDYRAAIADVGRARELYRTIGDRYSEARMLKNLGWACHLTGDYATAAAALRDSLTLYGALGDRANEASILGSLGWVECLSGDRAAATEPVRAAAAIYRELGRRSDEAFHYSLLAWLHHLNGEYDGAVERLRQALALYRETGDSSAQAFVLTHLAYVHEMRGEYPLALREGEQAREVYRVAGNAAGEASVRNILGRTLCYTGEYHRAEESIQQALALYSRLGNTIGEADARGNLGLLHRFRGEDSSSGDLLAQALQLYRKVGHRTGEAETLNRLGVLYAESDATQSLSTFQEALRLAREIRSLLEEARALEGIAHHRIRSGEPGEALADLDRAVALYTRLGAAETASAEESLRRLRSSVSGPENPK